jgi:colanic acid/amylovoran biosynthesis protein
MKQHPKRIIISHVYSSDNKGDAALTSVLIDDLKHAFPRSSITILQLESVKENKTFEGIPEKPGFMYYVANKYRHPLAKLMYASYMMGITLGWALWYKYTGRQLYLPAHLRKVALLYEQADLIVPVGGGYIRSRKGLRNRWNIPLILHPLLFGYLLDKPTILYPQSMGPFQNKFEELLVTFVLILIREDASVALLARLKVTRNVSRAIDSGFLLKKKGKVNIRKKYNIPASTLLVGVTVRQWLEGKSQQKYEKAVAGALDGIIKAHNAHVIFIPQVTATKGDDDRLASRRVYAHMRNKKAATVINDTPDHHRIKGIYGDLDILLGTRFHSVIFALTSYVPVVAIEYEHKTSGIMRDLELEKWVIKIEDVSTQRLSALLQALVGKQSRYQAHLRQHVPPYLRRGRKTIEVAEQALE